MRLPERITALKAFGLGAAIIVYLCAAIRTSPARCRILVPADQPSVVVEPMRVDVLTDTGERGLRIPENAGRGWCGEAGGLARYTFFVPTDGNYVLWTHCLWGQACTNAVYAQIDDSARTVIGNDPVYGSWHWVRGPSFPLKRGTHTLTLSNHSDGIALTRMMLLNDPFDQPDEGGPASYDLFYDGFDGCDGGNIAAWTLPAAGWRLLEPTEKDFSQRVLFGQSQKGEPAAVACVGDAAWSGYQVNLRVRVVTPGTMGIAFNYQDSGDCLVVQWICGASAELVRVGLTRHAGGEAVALGTMQMPMRVGDWHQMSVGVHSERLWLRLDGSLVGEVACQGELEGRVALLVSDGAAAWFDDLHVTMSETHGDAVASESLARKEAGCAAKSCD